MYVYSLEVLFFTGKIKLISYSLRKKKQEYFRPTI